MKFTSNYANKRVSKGEVNNEPSKTVQGESYTIKEMLAKQISGTLPQVQRQVVFTGPDETIAEYLGVPVYKDGFDLTDLDEAKRKAEYVMKTMETQKANTLEAKEKAKAKAIIDDYEKKKAELEKEKTQAPE